MPGVRPHARPGPAACWIAGAAVAAASVAWGGCAATTRYEVLSFFFDGVPDPALAAERAGPAYRVRTGALSLEERAAIQQRRFGRKTFYFHRPYAERKCNACHKTRAAGRADTTGSWFHGLPELQAPVEELCVKCHDFSAKRYLHAPAAAGLCIRCHHPHRSEFPHQLLARDARTLCARCHVAGTFVTENEHATHADRDCTACHDPHASDLRYFLKPDRPGAAGPNPSAAPAGARHGRSGK